MNNVREVLSRALEAGEATLHFSSPAALLKFRRLLYAVRAIDARIASAAARHDPASYLPLTGWEKITTLKLSPTELWVGLAENADLGIVSIKAGKPGETSE